MLRTSFLLHSFRSLVFTYSTFFLSLFIFPSFLPSPRVYIHLCVSERIIYRNTRRDKKTSMQFNLYWLGKHRHRSLVLESIHINFSVHQLPLVKVLKASKSNYQLKKKVMAFISIFCITDLLNIISSLKCWFSWCLFLCAFTYTYQEE